MLTGIANYLFGGAQDEQTESGSNNQNCDLKTRPAEDEWILVDKASRDPLQNGGEFRVPNPHPSHCPPSPHHSHSDSGSDNLLPDHIAPDESWLVTPPSCFTAGGSSSHQMASHPMEDLLIEHPSMSVYGLRGRPGSTGVESEHSESSNEGDADKNKNSTANRRTRAVETRTPRRPRAVAARAGLCARVQTVKSMQKSQQRQSARLLGKNRLDRSNKVREYESHSKRHRRKERLMQPSGRNNNRRC